MSKYIGKGIGTFENLDIDYQEEIVNARKLMGLKSTDLEQLSYTVGVLYVNNPFPELNTGYIHLLDEIRKRKEILFNIELGRLIPKD